MTTNGTDEHPDDGQWLSSLYTYDKNNQSLMMDVASSTSCDSPDADAVIGASIANNDSDEEEQEEHPFVIASHLVERLKQYACCNCDSNDSNRRRRRNDDDNNSVKNTTEIMWLLQQLTYMVSSMYHHHHVIVVAADVLEHVVQIIQHFQYSPPIVEVGLRFLLVIHWQNHVDDDDDDEDQEESVVDASHILQQVNGIVVIMSLLYTHRNNNIGLSATIQELGGRVIASWLWVDSLQDVVLEEGGLFALVNVMTRLPNNVNFQYIACQAIQYVLVIQAQQEDNSLAQRQVSEMFVTAGGMGTIVDIIISFGGTFTDEAVDAVTSACSVLAALADDCESVKVAFDALNGVSAVIGAMQHHMSNRSVQLTAMSAIRRLSTGCEDMMGEFGNAGVVGIVKSVMEEHSDDETVVTSAVITLGCLAMNNCVIADTMMIRGVLSTLVHAMTRHMASVNLQLVACATIGACALQQDSTYLNDAIQSTPTLIPTVMMAMNQHATNERFHVAASLTLKDVVANVDVSHNVVFSGGLDVLVATMKQFPLNVGLQGTATSTIGIIAESDDGMIEPIIVSGFVSALVGSICRLSSHESFVHNAIRVLCVLMKDYGDCVKEEILSAGGVVLFDFIGMIIDTCAVVERRLFPESLAGPGH